MRYEVGRETFYNIDDVINYCITEDYHDDEDDFAEWVNDEYGSIDIAGDSYYAYDIVRTAEDGNYRYLKERYQEQLNDDDRDEARYELGRASHGETVYIQGNAVYVFDPEEDEDTDAGETLINKYREKINEQKESDLNQDDYMKMFIGA